MVFADGPVLEFPVILVIDHREAAGLHGSDLSGVA
jgi:hypothetical protein